MQLVVIFFSNEDYSEMVQDVQKIVISQTAYVLVRMAVILTTLILFSKVQHTGMLITSCNCDIIPLRNNTIK
jgi:hypothetical protein